MNNLALINPEYVSEEEAITYPLREAARAIVIDENNTIALLHVTKENHYKLPGGGLEESEDMRMALHRECLEEIGCQIEIISEVGSIMEYRKIFLLRQLSYCYIAKVVGKKGATTFTDEEKKNGFELLWIPYEKASQLLSNNTAIGIESSLYIVPRDTIFLREAENELFKNKSN